jgi:hypothetical protein
MFESAMESISLVSVMRLMNLQIRVGNQSVKLDQIIPPSQRTPIETNSGILSKIVLL